MTSKFRFIDSANGTAGGRHYNIRSESGDGAERELRPEREGLPGGIRGLVRRVFKNSGWVLALDSAEIDPRQAVAAVMLLIELQIRGRGGMV